MNKLLLLVVLILSVTLVSCGNENKSGNRGVEYKVVRVKEIKSRKINWVRLNTIEQNIFRIGDTILINPTIHVLSPNNVEPEDTYKFVSVVIEK
jgi:hypothetical protein